MFFKNVFHPTSAYAYKRELIYILLHQSSQVSTFDIMEVKIALYANLFIMFSMLLTPYVISRPNNAIIQSVSEPSSSPSPSTCTCTCTQNEDIFQECGDKAGPVCGNAIFLYVFADAKIVTKECCAKLLFMGRRCHNLLTDATIKSKDFDEKLVSQIWSKNGEVWDRCNADGVIG